LSAFRPREAPAGHDPQGFLDPSAKRRAHRKRAKEIRADSAAKQEYIVTTSEFDTVKARSAQHYVLEEGARLWAEKPTLAHQDRTNRQEESDPNGIPTMTSDVEAAARFATVIDSFNESLERAAFRPPFRFRNGLWRW